jgi:hypothetical protein
MFRTGIPYDAETNSFQVTPANAHLIDRQREQIAEEETRAHHPRSGSVWDYWAQWDD